MLAEKEKIRTEIYILSQRLLSDGNIRTRKLVIEKGKKFYDVIEDRNIKGELVHKPPDLRLTEVDFNTIRKNVNVLER